MSGFENAYECLTNIQGFNSFQLSPSSSTEDIARAYQTQCMIWHPDKNPGDAVALSTYKRLQRAYDSLMDPESRAAHDAMLTEAQQAPAKAAGKPAAGPVAASGSDSDAASIRQPEPEDLGTPPPSARAFAYVDKEPQPRTPAANAGIRRGDAILRIGDAAHLRDVQSQLQASLHQPVPTLVVELSGRFVKKWVVPASWDPWAPASLLGCQMSDACPLDLQPTHPLELMERQRQRALAYPPAEEEGYVDDDEDERLLPPPVPAPCWARLLLFFASLLGVVLGAGIILYPVWSYHIVDIWQLPMLDCSDVIDERTVTSTEPSSNVPLPPSSPLGRLLQSEEGGAAEGETPHFERLVLATNTGADVIRDGVRGILAASCVMTLISLLGLVLSCLPPSAARGLLTGVYLCCGLPSWVLLIFVSVIAFALRDQADLLVMRYWDCLRAISQDPDDASLSYAAHEPYLHVEAAAAFCIVAAVALTVGMGCACRLIGWHAVARHAIIGISLATGLLGAALVSAGVVLYLTIELAKVWFDYSLMGLGGVVFIASLLGVLGSKRESPCLLRTYSVSLIIVLLGLLAVASIVLALGPEGLEAWMTENWEAVVQQHLLEVTREEMAELVAANVLWLVTLLVLLVLVLAFDLLMVWVLQCSVSRHGQLYQRTSEAQPLTRSREQKRGAKQGAGQAVN